DADSEFVLECLSGAGVNVSHVVRDPDARPIRATVVVDQTNATRTIFYDLAGVQGPTLDFPSEEVIHSARLLFIDPLGVEGMVRAARVARGAGIPIVADFESAEASGFHALCHLVDHLIVDRAFAVEHTGLNKAEQAAAALWGEGRGEVVVVTDGANGCWFQGRG